MFQIAFWELKNQKNLLKQSANVGLFSGLKVEDIITVLQTYCEEHGSLVYLTQFECVAFNHVEMWWRNVPGVRNINLQMFESGKVDEANIKTLFPESTGDKACNHAWSRQWKGSPAWSDPKSNGEVGILNDDERLDEGKTMVHTISCRWCSEHAYISWEVIIWYTKITKKNVFVNFLILTLLPRTTILTAFGNQVWDEQLI